MLLLIRDGHKIWSDLERCILLITWLEIGIFAARILRGLNFVLDLGLTSFGNVLRVS